MFADDLKLIREVVAKYGPLPRPVVDVGGLEEPTIADYDVTIAAMQRLRGANMDEIGREAILDAQMARYQRIRRPLAEFDPLYAIENPETGGTPIEKLWGKYDHAIGTAVVLSTLEHVRNPFHAIDNLWYAMSGGGLAIVSTPWIFPHHHGPEDNFRFSPTGLAHLFAGTLPWEVLESDWRLRIPADAGVLCTRTGKPQAVESSYLVARAR